MAQITFNKNKSANGEEFQAFAVFSVESMEGEFIEVELPVSGGDDIQKCMRLFLSKDWENLLPPDLPLPNDMVKLVVSDCEFKGIRLEGKKEEGRFSTHLFDGFVRNTVIVNDDVLLDKSAKKLRKIRDIILNE